MYIIILKLSIICWLNMLTVYFCLYIYIFVNKIRMNVAWPEKKST